MATRRDIPPMTASRTDCCGAEVRVVLDANLTIEFDEHDTPVGASAVFADGADHLHLVYCDSCGRDVYLPPERWDQITAFARGVHLIHTETPR